MMNREILGSLVLFQSYLIQVETITFQNEEGKLWYNAFEKDIAVANFYFSKPTTIGKKRSYLAKQ